MISSRIEIAETLRKKGYKATPQRILIYEGIWNAGSHPSVSEIHKFVSLVDPSISLATVYRNLQLFSEIGLVQEMGIKEKSARYDPDVRLHINLVCNRCGNIEDYEHRSLDEIALNLGKTMGFLVQSHEFEVRGFCSSCQNK